MHWANKAGRKLVNAGAGRWQARVDKQPATQLMSRMPLHSAGLFKHLPLNWQPWQRIGHWPNTAQERSSVTYTWKLPTAAKGSERMEVMLLGNRDFALQGAKLISRQSRCLSSRCSKDKQVARLLLIDLNKGVKQLSFTTAPLSGSLRDALYEGESRHLALVEKRPHWLAASGRPKDWEPAEVTLNDRNGTPLWRKKEITRRAATAGLGSLVGVSRGQESSLTGMLARRGSTRSGAC